MTSTRAFGACSRVLMAVGKGSTGTVTKEPATTKTRTWGIQKVVPVSSQLGKFLGTSEASRTEAVKKVWQHIKLHNLQNPANKKEIVCDDKLKTLFDGKDKVGFTEIARHMSHHFKKA